jgi:hypothetical protein
LVRHKSAHPAITLVGFPTSLTLLAFYLTAICLTKIWLGAFPGQKLLKPTEANKSDCLLGLLVGLLILTILGFIPYVGGLVRFVVVCLGLGAFAWQLYRVSQPAMTPESLPIFVAPQAKLDDNFVDGTIGVCCRTIVNSLTILQTPPTVSFPRSQRCTAEV